MIVLAQAGVAQQGPGALPPGAWQATLEVRADVTEGAMREFFNERNASETKKFLRIELEEKKRTVVASFALSLICSRDGPGRRPANAPALVATSVSLTSFWYRRDDWPKERIRL